MIYILIGLTITIALYKMLIEFKVSSTVALLFSMFCVLSPPVILYENWLFYTYPAVCLLLLSIIFLINTSKNQPVYLFLFFSSLGLIVTTRTLFQPIWFLTILVLMIILAIKGQKFLDLSHAEMFVIRYIVFNIIYITLIGNLIEVGENMHFRFLILPSLYILVALFLRYLMTRKT